MQWIELFRLFKYIINPYYLRYIEDRKFLEMLLLYADLFYKLPNFSRIFYFLFSNDLTPEEFILKHKKVCLEFSSQDIYNFSRYFPREGFWYKLFKELGILGPSYYLEGDTLYFGDISKGGEDAVCWIFPIKDI